MLKNVKDKPEYANSEKVIVDNHKDGEYIEQYDINSKYERRDIKNHPEFDDLSFSHMAMMFHAFGVKKKKTTTAKLMEKVKPRMK
jgi:hypothetical protein